MTREILRTQVLIVGAGPAGLALAIELGSRGIKCLVVEKNDRVGYAPRAKTTNVRTREHLRRWGIAQNLAAESPFGVDYPSNIVFATRLAGPLLARFENAFNCRPDRNDAYAEHAQWIPQYTLEKVLLARAASLAPVKIRFGCELADATQTPRCVTAQLVEPEESNRFEVQADYMIGADGARSTVRTLLGIRMEGPGRISEHFNIIIRAPGLAARHPHGPAIMYWLVNPEVPSVIAPMDRDDKWSFGCTRLSDRDVDPKDLVRRATGLPLELDVLSADEWTAQRLIATRYHEGRMFLAGDACHLHPPFGGYGMNMGVGDAVDLGWKIAATLQGWGGDALLATYELERRPVHERVMDEAVANHAVLGQQLSRPDIEAAGTSGDAIRAAVGQAILANKMREFKTLGVVIGYRYEGSPIIIDDGSQPPPTSVNDYEASAHPGCRAPHVWLREGTGRGASLFDHFGLGFSLLVTDPSGIDAADRLARAAEQSRVPLTVVAPSTESLRNLYASRFALIRPDQHVAWRGDAIPENAGALLDRVRGAAIPA